MSLHELCVDNKSKHLEIIKYLYETPQIEDAQVEKAAKVMGELFFSEKNNEVFVLKTKALKLLEHNKLSDIDSASRYIQKWFEAMNSRVHMFMGVEWLLMTCYFVSACFLRHKSIQSLDHDTKNTYQRTSKTLYEDYQKITNAA